MKNRTIIGLVIAFLLLLITMNPGLLPLSPETAEKMKELRQLHFLIDGSGKMTIAHILTLIGAISLLWILFTVIRLILEKTAKNTHSRTIAILLTELFRYLAVIIAVIWGLSILGVNTSALLAGAGIISLIIGFGAQSLIEDIITGLFIIFERQYEIGDIIILDEFRGVVRAIGVRTTTIEDVGGNLKVVNNSDIRNFQNRSKNNSYSICLVGVSYNTNIPAMEEAIAEALPEIYEDNQDLFLDVPEYLGIEEFADSSMVLKFQVLTKEENVFRSRRRLNRELKIMLDEAGIEIPFPQVVVHPSDN